MTGHRPSLPAAPRWPVLALLTAAVLGVHLVLLAGDISLTPAPANGPSTAVDAPATEATDASARAVPAPFKSTQPAQVSTVRWIVPEPALAPPAKPAPHTPPRVKPPVAKAPPPPVAPPAPLPEASQQPPEPPIDTVASAQPDLAEPPATVVAEASPPEAPAPIPTEAPAEAPAEAQAPAADSRPAEPPRTTEPPSAQPPASTRLLYDVTGNVKGIGYKAQGTLDWSLTEDRYEARMEMRVMLLGSRSQTSTGRIGPAGLIPERFADQSRSEKAAHFDTTQQRIRFSSNAPEVPLQPGAQDRLSLFLQLASLLQARPQAYTAGQTVEMQVAGTGDAPLWRFEVGEESTISLPAGEFKVRHLVRQPRKAFDSTVEMWLAPSLHHLPVRLRVTQSNGDVADQRLSQMP